MQPPTVLVVGYHFPCACRSHARGRWRRSSTTRALRPATLSWIPAHCLPIYRPTDITLTIEHRQAPTQPPQESQNRPPRRRRKAPTQQPQQPQQALISPPHRRRQAPTQQLQHAQIRPLGMPAMMPPGWDKRARVGQLAHLPSPPPARHPLAPLPTHPFCHLDTAGTRVRRAQRERGRLGFDGRGRRGGRRRYGCPQRLKRPCAVVGSDAAHGAGGGKANASCGLVDSGGV